MISSLARDTDKAALEQWSVRNACPYEPRHELPGTGEHLLLSRLEVLTPDEFRALVAADVQIATCNGLDARNCVGIGTFHKPLLGVLDSAVAAWCAPGATSPALDPNSPQPAGMGDVLAKLERLENDVDHAVDVITRALVANVQAAWAWHCEIAGIVTALGAGGKTASKVAQLVMARIFGVHCPDHTQVVEGAPSVETVAPAPVVAVESTPNEPVEQSPVTEAFNQAVAEEIAEAGPPAPLVEVAAEAPAPAPSGEVVYVLERCDDEGAGIGLFFVEPGEDTPDGGRAKRFTSLDDAVMFVTTNEMSAYKAADHLISAPAESAPVPAKPRAPISLTLGSAVAAAASVP